MHIFAVFLGTLFKPTVPAVAYVEPLFDKAEMTYLPTMCEHSERILADSVHPFEALLGRED